MSRLWWVCAIVLWISTPLIAQHESPRLGEEGCAFTQQAELASQQQPCLWSLQKTGSPASPMADAVLHRVARCLAQPERTPCVHQEFRGSTAEEPGRNTDQESTPRVQAGTQPLTRYEAGLDLFARVQPSDASAAQVDFAAPSKKSPGLAVIYSLLLPGMGELYAEGFSSGKYFLIAEGALWLGYAGMQIHADDLRDGARSFAAAHAGVDATGKDDDFYVNVGNFMSVEEYNDKKLRDREPDKVYDPLAGYRWRWDSDAARQTFRDQRISSENWYNNQKFVAAAIVINHIVSAVNAARAAISYNNAQDDALGSLQLSSRLLGDAGQPHGVLITIAREF